MTTEEKNKLAEDYYAQYQNIGTGTDKPTYAGTYDEQIKSIYDQIANREDFTYDLNGDALYQQYKDNYIQQGKQAMKDTMGQAAALTGGYGSSYSQAAGQQAYDASLQNLSNMIPELWNMAYQVYSDKGTQLQNQYSMLSDLANTEYTRYQNDLSNWNNDQTTAYNKYIDAINRAAEEEETEYTRQQNEDATAWSRQQTNYSNLSSLIAASGYSPSDAELAAAGMSRAQANALIAAYQASLSSGSGSGTASTETGEYTVSASDLSKAVNSGNYTASEINEWLQNSSNGYTNSAGGVGLTYSGKSGNLTKNSDGTYTYSNSNSSKAATDTINKILASLKK